MFIDIVLATVLASGAVPGMTMEEVQEFDVRCTVTEPGMMVCQGQIEAGARCLDISPKLRMCEGDSLEEQTEREIRQHELNQARKWSA